MVSYICDNDLITSPQWLTRYENNTDLNYKMRKLNLFVKN